jgi:spore germination protein KA
MFRIFKKAKHAMANQKTTPQKPQIRPEQKEGIYQSLSENLARIQQILNKNTDVNIREFTIGSQNKNAFIVNIEGLTDTRAVNDHVLGKLMMQVEKTPLRHEIHIETIKNAILSIHQVQTTQTLDEAMDALLSGCTVLFLDKDASALIIMTQAFEHRGVEKPETENVVRGPHESFSESIRVNTSLVRRKIKNTHLKIESMEIGNQTKTIVNILYIDNLAKESIVDEVKSRLSKIQIDSVLESGYIEDFISDAPLSILPTVGNTEIPDRFAGRLLEGRVGIFVDGTPIALTVPYLFMEGITSQEDYYSRPFLSSYIRLIRILALHGSLYLPALYVAIVNFHPYVLPDRLLYALTNTRSGIPFPASVEAVFMILLWEILREAGIRIPRVSGQAISIVGALIIGEVAVSAGLVGPIMVVIIAATGLMGYLFNPQLDSITLLRLPLLFFSAIFGLFGTFFSYIFLFVHLSSLRSFGVPYLSPIAPFSLSDMKDFILRAPWPFMNKRPRYLGEKNPVRVPMTDAKKHTIFMKGNQPDG